MTPQATDISCAPPPPASALAPYPDPDRPGCWRVPVASRVYRMEAIIDADSLPLVQGKRWNWSPGSGGTMKRGSVVWRGPMTPLARIIMGVTDPELLVSHVNGDKLDCRRENLIVRTRSEVALARKPSPETVARLRPYPDPDRSGVWRVPLRSHLAHREALIDEADLPTVEGNNWNWHERGDGTCGHVILATVDSSQTPLARLIAGATHWNDRVSHANGDPLDCRRENLVLESMAEQARRNQKMGSLNGRRYTSTFKGVSWDEPRGKWKAQIRKGAIHRHIGRFEDELDAAEAYDKAARELFGEHAWLNFPNEGERGRSGGNQVLHDALRLAA